MSLMTNPETKTEYSIHPDTKMGAISLTVANLENQLKFYQQAMGFQLHWRDGNRAGLGSGGKDFLLLTEEPGLKKYRGVTGLYHVAYVFPNKRELAIAIARLFAIKYPNSPTDHIMTKTTYLDDLEGNGIELYCESPEDGTWHFANGKYESIRADGSWSNGREALDLEALFQHLKEDDRIDAPIPPETRIGHVHLHVRNVDEAVDFYHGIRLRCDGRCQSLPDGLRFCGRISPPSWPQHLAGRGRSASSARRGWTPLFHHRPARSKNVRGCGSPG